MTFRRSVYLAFTIVLHLTATVAGTSSQTDLFDRIKAGDYVWSKDFFKKEAALVGYANGFILAVRGNKECSRDYPVTPEEEIFALGWTLTDFRQDFRAMLAASLVGRAMHQDAGERANALIKSEGCRGPNLTKVMDNAVRLMGGRRPKHGGPGDVTLVHETSSRLNGRHIYPGIFGTRTRAGAADAGVLQSSGMAVLTRQLDDFAALGFMVLECHYDTDLRDQYWEVQYYWTGAVASVAARGWLGLSSLVDSAQIALRNANQAPVRHPFLDYGSPRTECPSRRDPLLPVKEILPSTAANAPPSAGRSGAGSRDNAGRSAAPPPSAAAAPTMVNGRWEYGLVPDDFVPPLVADRRGAIYIRMTKRQAGSLNSVALDSLGFHHLGQPLGFDSWGAFSTARPADFRLLNDDFGAVQQETRSPAWKGSPAIDGFVHTVIVCGYQDSPVAYRFWYKVRPSAADPVRLRTRLADHPMLKIGAPVETCPASETQAKAP